MLQRIWLSYMCRYFLSLFVMRLMLLICSLTAVLNRLLSCQTAARPPPGYVACLIVIHATYINNRRFISKRPTLWEAIPSPLLKSFSFSVITNIVTLRKLHVRARLNTSISNHSANLPCFCHFKSNLQASYVDGK